MKYYNQFQSLKEELEAANQRLHDLEEHKVSIDALKREYEMKLFEMEKVLSCSVAAKATDEATINQLKLELSKHEAHVGVLNDQLDSNDVINVKYLNEIQDLKYLIMVEQQEKDDLQKKLQNAENDLKIMMQKNAEQEKEFLSAQHVDALKQKVMKLRKDNESLKRRLQNAGADSL